MTEDLMRVLLFCILSTILILLPGCKAPSNKLPHPQYVLDVYLTEEGFFVIVDRETGSSIGYRMNVAETHQKSEGNEE